MLDAFCLYCTVAIFSTDSIRWVKQGSGRRGIEDEFGNIRISIGPGFRSKEAWCYWFSFDFTRLINDNNSYPSYIRIFIWWKDYLNSLLLQGSTYFCEASNHWGVAVGPSYHVAAPSISRLDPFSPPRPVVVEVAPSDDQGLRLKCDTGKVTSRPEHGKPTWTKVLYCRLWSSLVFISLVNSICIGHVKYT